ncbi:MAG: hypothetical protein AAB724_00430 [Patescibacteria group bacterium]
MLFYAFDHFTLSYQPTIIGFGRRGERARFPALAGRARRFGE